MAAGEKFSCVDKIVGVDAEPKAIGSRSDPNLMLEEWPAQSSIEFCFRCEQQWGELVELPPAVISLSESILVGKGWAATALPHELLIGGAELPLSLDFLQAISDQRKRYAPAPTATGASVRK